MLYKSETSGHFKSLTFDIQGQLEEKQVAYTIKYFDNFKWQ